MQKAFIACNYAEQRCYGDVDFDYGVDHLDVFYDDDDDNDDDDDDDDDADEYYNSNDSEFNDSDASFRRTHALNSSISFTDVGLELFRFTKFCQMCQQIILLCFVNRLYILTKR